jgi:hypothetical protein
MPDPQTPLAIIVGAAYFVVMCGVGTAVGLGILAALRFHGDGVKSVLLAPSVATMAWALSCNLLARLGLPVKDATPVIWAASAVLVFFGIRWWLRSTRPFGRTRWSEAGLLVGIGTVVIIVAWPHFTRGLTASLGSPNLDTVYYTAAASAYWQYGPELGAQVTGFFERLAPFFEYAGAARNHTYVLLALFSPIVQAGEPMYFRNLFVPAGVYLRALSRRFARTWRSRLPSAVSQSSGAAAVDTTIRFSSAT